MFNILFEGEDLDVIKGFVFVGIGVMFFFESIVFEMIFCFMIKFFIYML